MNEDEKARVTDRLTTPVAPVTDRLPDGGVSRSASSGNGHITDVLSRDKNGASDASRYLEIGIGDVVADRYLIEEGPLGGVTGESEVFQCIDQQTGLKLALKYYRPNISPKAQVPEQLLNLDHPNIVSLRDFGGWSGRFFEVMEFCEGGNLLDDAPYRERELKGYIRDIAIGLKYCHDQGIIHRDIKPNNLFFRDANKEGVVIGDFGISSILSEGEMSRITGTFDFSTIDYAPWELSVKHEVSVKTDFYALGITLIHLLLGISPFQGMDPKAVLEKHIYGKVPFPDGLSDEFRGLLKGLLRLSSQKRWGFNQVMAWSKGLPILTDGGLPDQDEMYEGKEHPFPECKEARNPLELAGHLDAFDAENALFRGRISNWVYVHFDDAKLAKRIEEIEEDYTDRKQLGVFKLRHTLDASLPLKINDDDVYSIKDLVELLQSSDESLLTALEDALWGEFIECWIDAALRGRDEAKIKELVEKIRDIRTRLKNKERRLAVFALLYTLDPMAPLKLAAGVTISTPGQLEEVLVGKPELLSVVKEYLYGGQFEEWLRAAFPEKTEDHAFVFQCRNTFMEAKDLGVYAFRWHFSPSVPFPFGDQGVVEPKELARLIDGTEQDRNRGIELLSKGWIHAWLKTTRKNWKPDAFDKVVNDAAASWGRKMEAVLHFLDAELPRPTIAADRNEIKLGKVGTESSKTVEIRFSNSGRGFLSGSFSLESPGADFSISPTPLEGEPAMVSITINPQGLPAGSRRKATLVAGTNGGRMEIPISYRVAAPLAKMIARSMGVGALCAIAFGFYRGIIQWAVAPAGVLDWYDWERTETILDRPDMILWMTLLAGIIGGGIYYLVRMGKVGQKG